MHGPESGACNLGTAAPAQSSWSRRTARAWPHRRCAGLASGPTRDFGNIQTTLGFISHRAFGGLTAHAAGVSVEYQMDPAPPRVNHLLPLPPKNGGNVARFGLSKMFDTPPRCPRQSRRDHR